MSDNRRFVNDIAARWRTACDAIRGAGGEQVTIPATDLSVLLFGYEQLRKERNAGLKLTDDWARSGMLDNTGEAAMSHALGVISDEEWESHLAAASEVRPEDCAPSEVPE